MPFYGQWICSNQSSEFFHQLYNGHIFLDHSELFVDHNKNDHINMRVRTHSKLRN
jgi:hypothetical protein